MVVPELINLPLEGEADAIATVWMDWDMKIYISRFILKMKSQLFTELRTEAIVNMRK